LEQLKSDREEKNEDRKAETNQRKMLSEYNTCTEDARRKYKRNVLNGRSKMAAYFKDP
jgi:hypothetical protein